MAARMSEAPHGETGVDPATWFRVENFLADYAHRLDDGKIEKVPFGGPGTPAVAFQKDQNWNAGLNVSQPLFAGGKIEDAQA